MAESKSAGQASKRPDQLTPELEREIAEVEVLVGHILLVGVIVSTAIIVVGVVLMLIQNDSQAAFHVASYASVATSLVALRGWAVVYTGLFLLILTPVMRVAVSILGFARCHDKVFVVITCYVLAVLILGFLIGTAGH